MKLKIFFILLLLLIFNLPSYAEEGGGDYQLKRYELAVAGGTSLNAEKTTQVMLILGMNVKTKPNLFLRVEPTLEYFTKEGHQMFVGGSSLVLRFVAPHKGITPFVDMGAGANFSTRNNFLGRRLGDHFLFDLILGGGFNLGKRYSISYRYRHLSDAGLFTYNDGIDSHYIVFGVYFK